MTPQPTHELIRDLIAANFPIQIVGNAAHTSQFGVPYIAFVQGVAVPQGKSIGKFTTPISRADVNMATVEWISQQPRDHDVVVWRTMPEEIMPEYGNAYVCWRLHTMSRADLIAKLRTMPPLGIDHYRQGTHTRNGFVPDSAVEDQPKTEAFK